MEITKRKLFQVYHETDYYYMEIYERWNDWRKMHEKGDPPYHFEWEPHCCSDVMHFWWRDSDGKKQSEDVPLSVFYDDHEQPDLKMIWHSGFWDGPLSGLAEYNGEKVWFDCVEDVDNQIRRYAVYRLSTEELREVERNHKRFEKMVGYHCNHDETHKEYGDVEKWKFCPIWAHHLWRKILFDVYYKRSIFGKVTWVKKPLKRDFTENEKLGEFDHYEFKNYCRPR